MIWGRGRKKSGHKWGAGSNPPVSLRFLLIWEIFIFLILLLIAPGIRTTGAVEPGSGRVRFWQGMENTGVGFQRFNYVALGADVDQPTLNWGKWRANFLGLGDDWGRRMRLGTGFLGVRELWLREHLEGDFHLGDSLLQTGELRLPFEHFVIPTQSLRGLVSDLYNSKYKLGLHVGNLTLLSYQLPEAFVSSDTDVVGFYFRLGETLKSHGGLSLDNFSDLEGDRWLSNFYLAYPLGGPWARAICWFDSRSERLAGVIGVRQAEGLTQWEVGWSHIPYGFVYFGENASLPAGQSLGFATYRRTGLVRNYYLEGSGGRLSFGSEEDWLVRGSIGGGWRFRLRDSLGASLGVSWRGPGTDRSQLHLLPRLRYSRWRPRFNFYAQLLADYYTIRYTTRGRALVVQPAPLGGAAPETVEETRVFRWSIDTGFDYSPPTGTRWGGSLRYDDTQSENGLSTSSRSVTAELRLAKYLPYDTSLDLSIRSGFSWSEGQTSGVHGGTMRLTISYWENWLVFIEGRFWWSQFPGETFGFYSVPNPAYETRCGSERRFYWGEGAPIYGMFPATGLKGVGTLSGMVFEDRNGNNIYDTGDVPIKDAVLRLDEGYIVETDIRGIYYYPNVADGNHTLELDPESYPVRLTPEHPEGIRFKLFPRQKRRIDWPLH